MLWGTNNRFLELGGHKLDILRARINWQEFATACVKPALIALTL
jgi:hypothetical protein